MITESSESQHSLLRNGATSVSSASFASSTGHRRSPTKEAGRYRIAFVELSFVLLFGLLSPIYYLSRWDFMHGKKRNPFYASWIVRLKERYPLLYEFAQVIENFPAWHRIYEVLPEFSGDVLQVGCGTGLLNKFLRHRSDIRFTNLDPNLNALRMGVRLKRYSEYVQGYIDRRIPLADRSFDVVVFAQSFHHIRNHRKAFAECGRLLREGGRVIIADPVVLKQRMQGSGPTGYMANSSIDGVIWRFTLDAFVKHLEECLPSTLAIRSVECIRQPHVTNYNLFVPQSDVVAVVVKGSPQDARSDHQTHCPGQG